MVTIFEHREHEELSRLIKRAAVLSILGAVFSESDPALARELYGLAYEGGAGEHTRKIIEPILADNPVGRRVAIMQLE